jgi:hypothetical protein
VAGSLPNNSTLADRTFLSYEYDGLDSGDFIVQSREVAAINDPGSENQFGDLLSLRDSDFYFTWVDFTNPLSVATPGIPGDFDGDGDVDGTDLGIWQGAYSTDDSADADSDGDSDGRDFLIWQRNFTGAPALAANSTVPEPSAISLMLLGAAWFATSVRKRSF